MALERLRQLADSSIEAVVTETAKSGGEPEVKYNANAAATAIKAIETANKMLGYNEPEKETGEDGVMIVFGEGEDFTE